MLRSHRVPGEEDRLGEILATGFDVRSWHARAFSGTFNVTQNPRYWINHRPLDLLDRPPTYHSAEVMVPTTRSISAPVKLIGNFATAVGLLLVVLTVAGFLGGVWWGFDLAAHFRVQYAALLVPAFLVPAWLRRRGIALLTGTALAVNLALIIPLYLAPPTPPDGSGTLQILSFNVTASNPERDAVIDYLDASAADIIFVHETSIDWEEALAGSSLPYRIVSARAPGSLFGTLALLGGDAVAKVVALGDAGQLSIEVTTELSGSEIKVLGTHPLSPVSPGRAAARDEQLRAVGEWAARQTFPVVVTGDFNASTWSRGFSLVSEGGLVNSQRGFGVQASWPVGHSLFSIPIDHLVHTADLTTIDRRLGENFGSDHYPLFATIARSSSLVRSR